MLTNTLADEDVDSSGSWQLDDILTTSFKKEGLMDSVVMAFLELDDSFFPTNNS